MTTATTTDIPELLKQIQKLLDIKCRRRKYHLHVPKNGYSVEDDWITIVVTPTGTGIRAYDYVGILADVEKELRDSGHEHVLLVPAMPG